MIAPAFFTGVAGSGNSAPFLLPGLDYNTAVVLLGTGLLGLVSGIIGSFAVLSRRALLGDALAHAALPGICLAFLIVELRTFTALLTGAFVTALLGVAAIAFITRNTRTREDAALGIVLSVFFGAGVVLMKVIEDTSVAGSKAGLDSFIFGKTASMLAGDVYALAGLVFIVLVAVLVLYKEFKVVSFDADFAAVQGWPTLLLDLLLLGLLTVTIVVGLPAVGVVLMAALLILPGAAARFWTERLWVMLLLSGVFGLVTGVTGTLVSSSTRSVDLPAGPTIVLVGSTVFLASMAFAPERGFLARLARRLGLRRQVVRQNFLRAAYELSEATLPRRRVFGVRDIAARRSWKPAVARRAFRTMERGGLVARRGPDDEWSLTAEGVRQAAAVVRSHRLWELYLIEYADIAADHVDRDADLIEHVLPQGVLEEMEEELRRTGRLPSRGAVPGSPHEIGEEAGP